MKSLYCVTTKEYDHYYVWAKGYDDAAFLAEQSHILEDDSKIKFGKTGNLRIKNKTDFNIRDISKIADKIIQ